MTCGCFCSPYAASKEHGWQPDIHQEKMNGLRHPEHLRRDSGLSDPAPVVYESIWNVPPDLSRRKHLGCMQNIVLNSIVVIVITIAFVIIGRTIIAVITIILAKEGGVYMCLG